MPTYFVSNAAARPGHQTRVTLSNGAEFRSLAQYISLFTRTGRLRMRPVLPPRAPKFPSSPLQHVLHFYAPTTRTNQPLPPSRGTQRSSPLERLCWLVQLLFPPSTRAQSSRAVASRTPAPSWIPASIECGQQAANPSSRISDNLPCRLLSPSLLDFPPLKLVSIVPPQLVLLLYR